MDELGALIAAQESWRDVGYWILVAGLIGDIAALVIPRHRERLEKILAGIFTVVIIVGVALEHSADNKISDLIGRQERLASERVAALVKEAEQAKSQSAEATTRAKEADEKAEAERLARVKIEERMAESARQLGEVKKQQQPRIISDTDEQNIVSALAPYAGQKISVTFAVGTFDGPSLAQRLTAILKKADWDVVKNGPFQGFFSGPGPFDCQPTINENDANSGRVPAGFKALVDALASAGLGAPNRGYVDPKLPSGVIDLRIGPKRPPSP